MFLSRDFSDYQIIRFGCQSPNAPGAADGKVLFAAHGDPPLADRARDLEEGQMWIRHRRTAHGMLITKPHRDPP